MKIGLLLVRSVLYPALSFDLADGLRSSLEANGITGTELLTESIDLAAKDQLIYSKAEHLILAGASVVVAYINPMSAEFIQPLFENSGTILLVLDSGYHYPTKIKKYTNTYYISLQGALCCRIAARMAAAEGSQNFAYACSFYDAGYRSGDAYTNGIQAGGGQLVFNHVTALDKKNFDLAPLLNEVQGGKADTVMAAFCGDMAQDFLEGAKQTNLFALAKVYGSSFMAEEIWLDKMDYPGHDWMAAVPWSQKLDNPENQAFLKAMQKKNPNKANIFSLIAWEAGMFISKITNSGQEPPQAVKELEGTTFQSPRGTLFVNPETHFIDAPVYSATVVQNEGSGKCRLEHLQLVDYTEEERSFFYKDVENLSPVTNSWLNAYACIDS